MFKQIIGGFSVSDKSRIRILMAAWLMGAFVLIGFYTTELFGYLVTNLPVPVVNSAEELADKHTADLVVVTGWAPDLTITVQEYFFSPVNLAIHFDSI